MEQENIQKERSSWIQFWTYIKDKFNLDEDKAAEDEVKENIIRSVEFRGTNLWVLMFAIVIASVGLNVNSTAVIIGAMLVSPLMGPIMGIGLSLAINDFELLKRSGRNFLLAVTISLVVSTLYFAITPLSNAQSELLARTTPTIWDVLIASFGGLAGIVAQSRRDRTSTVIPGVAIATALMPPLCTAGFGLATGNWAYFGGAFYLFFINAVFIAFSTFFVVRFLKYEKKVFLDKKRERRVKNTMIIIITATLVPSIILAYRIVQHAVFEGNAEVYIQNVLNFKGTEVVSRNVRISGSDKVIEVTLIGEPVSVDAVAHARSMLSQYSLSDAELVVNQSAVSGGDFDSRTIENFLKNNSDILNEKNKRIAELEQVTSRYNRDTLAAGDIVRELTSLWDGVSSVNLSRAADIGADGMMRSEVVLCVITTDNGRGVSVEDRSKLVKWLKARTKQNNVRLIVNPAM